MLSIPGNDFIACWAYAEPISSHTEHTRNEFWHAQPAVKCEELLHVQSMLSIPGTNFIAHWAYAEGISSHAEHAQKCLKVKYLSRIEYDFQKSCVTGPGDHMVLVSAKKVKKKIHACVPLKAMLLMSFAAPSELTWTLLSYPAPSALGCTLTSYTLPTKLQWTLLCY